LKGYSGLNKTELLKFMNGKWLILFWIYMLCKIIYPSGNLIDYILKGTDDKSKLIAESWDILLRPVCIPISTL